LCDVAEQQARQCQGPWLLGDVIGARDIKTAHPQALKIVCANDFARPASRSFSTTKARSAASELIL
jgi:hypothetical protein